MVLSNRSTDMICQNTFGGQVIISQSNKMIGMRENVTRYIVIYNSIKSQGTRCYYFLSNYISLEFNINEL